MTVQFDRPDPTAPDAPRTLRPWVWNPASGQVDVTRTVGPGEPEPDHFSVLGLPRRLLVDADALEIAHRSLIRALHPDRYHLGGPAQVALAQDHASRVNDAIRALRTLPQRVAYVLALAGEPAEERFVPSADLLMAVMEANEALDEAGENPAAVQDVARDFAVRKTALDADLALVARAWDEAEASGDAVAAAQARTRLRAILGQTTYLQNLIGRAEAALTPRTAGSLPA